ncbi:MAG: adenylate/guanylate cyclase domain-containing protein [Chthoniobacterales bacterium]
MKLTPAKRSSTRTMSDERKQDLQLEIGHVLFIDIVGYSKLLINEQSEVLQELNEVVRGTARFRASDAAGKLIRLPAGDGMALVFRDSPEAPAACALEIAQVLKSSPHIQVRMGIHSGPVNEIVDVNERSNIAGAGINIAQRVMDCGDAGHILVSKRVADDLAQYRHWQPLLHDLGECEVKHGVVLAVANLHTNELGNPIMPKKFAELAARLAPGPTGPAPSVNRWRMPSYIAIALLVLAGGIGIFLRQSSRQLSTSVPPPLVSPSPNFDKSIAVMPFIDLSQAKDQEYFCDGISEEILDTLAKVEGLRVVARTSSFSFKGKDVGVGEIAQKLGVQNILEGSLRRDGNRIRVTAQLISARDGFHLWSETYEREIQGVFAMQDEITHAITDALKLKLIGVRPAVEQAQSSEAHDLYLQGVFFSNKSTEAELRKSLEFFQRSVEKDPSSARAWTGIAKVWNWLADAYVKPVEAYPAMRAAALKAVSLDDREVEAHAYIAEAKRVLDWDVLGAEAELRRALQIDPNSGITHLFLALNLGVQGKPEESMAEARQAVKADPLSPIINNMAAVSLLANNQVDEAITQAKRISEVDPDYLYEFPVLGFAYLQKGMLPEAIELFKKAHQATGFPQAGLGIAYAMSGQPAEARQILAELERTAATSYFPGEEIASVYVALGDHDSAFAWLDRAYAEHSGPLHAVAVRWAFYPLRSDPRFAVFLQRIGLDPAKVLKPTPTP